MGNKMINQITAKQICGIEKRVRINKQTITIIRQIAVMTHGKKEDKAIAETHAIKT
jgi:hypothetical protein